MQRLALPLLALLVVGAPAISRAQARIVEVHGDDPELGLALILPDAERRVCVVGVTGCELDVDPGTYRFRVARGDDSGGVHEVRLRGGERIELGFDDRRHLRAAGVALALLGPLVGAVIGALPFLELAITGSRDWQSALEDVRGAVLGLGVGMILASWIAGAALVGLRDVGDVRVIPGGLGF